MVANLEELKALYEIKKSDIRARLKTFRQILNSSPKKIFAELCFCICTPQSKAETCDSAIKALLVNGILFTGTRKAVRSRLKGVRFYNTKSNWIVKARKFLNGTKNLTIIEKLKSFSQPEERRNWLVEIVYGLGMKEASHFLRNIGLAQDLAILDRHIIKNLIAYGVIDTVPRTLTTKRYLEIERAMRFFCAKNEIPMEEMDLLLWSKETGKIFK